MWSYAMIKFKEFLIEQGIEPHKVETTADVVFQKILDHLDHTHIDIDDRSIRFHVGVSIKNTTINLSVVIRNGSSNTIRMGTHKDSGDPTIVIDIRGELPARTKLHDFLAKDTVRARKIKGLIVQYLNSDKHNPEHVAEFRTTHEEETEVNSEGTFEEKYEAMIRKVKERIEEFKGSIEELKDEMNTEDKGKKEIARRAMTHLGNEQFGETEAAFKKIAEEIFVGGQKDGIRLLSKENKEKLEKRLASFYVHKIKPLLVKA